MKLNEKIYDFIEKEKNIILFILITIMAWLVRMFLINFVSGDFQAFIGNWFYELKENGGLHALNINIGDYNSPYITILALLTYLPINPVISVKMVSIIFDYICAFAVMKIINIIFDKNQHRELYGLLAYGVILFLPTVILNSACWGQADSIYTAFVLISIKYLLEKKYLKSFIFLGISFAFKLQFIFILPVYILVYIADRKFPIYYFLIIPIVNLIMCIPAIIFGKSILSCINVYINQTSEWAEYLCMNFPGICSLLFPISKYNYVVQPSGNIAKVGILITIFIYVLIAFMVIYKKIKFDKQRIIEFSLWSIMIATFFLPRMHDRYLFMGDILSILYFIYNKDKIYVPIGISMVSTYCYSVYLFNNNTISIKYISLVYFILIILVSKDICRKYFVHKEVEKK